MVFIAPTSKKQTKNIQSFFFFEHFQTLINLLTLESSSSMSEFAGLFIELVLVMAIPVLAEQNK
jgi:hypothetical protein